MIKVVWGGAIGFPVFYTSKAGIGRLVLYRSDSIISGFVGHMLSVAALLSFSYNGKVGIGKQMSMTVFHEHFIYKKRW